MNEMRSATLLLEKGLLFRGMAFGAKGTTGGEIVFHTGMTGYSEIFTDPSYYGQILVMAYPHIGNYGVAAHEWQSGKSHLRGIVVRDFSVFYSRGGKALGLEEFLRLHQVIALAGVDTRYLIQEIRTQGAQRAILSTEVHDPESLHQELQKIPLMEGSSLVRYVTTSTPYTLGESSWLRIAVLDLGVKKAILQQLLQRDAYVGVFPAYTPWEEIQAFEPSAFVLSNGPGDPAALPELLPLAQKMIQTRKPILGICLGHQILSLALGVPTYKLPYGHHGANHPVRELTTGRIFITSQNHGFAIDKQALDKHPHLYLTHLNLLDGTVEGFAHKELPILGVQYHPEAAPGPHESLEIFTKFFQQITTPTQA
ncbi:MAG: glutamine-hydrolyzing carbamoyl-phosphate synthase small subunit [Bacteroidia bacterium]